MKNLLENFQNLDSSYETKDLYIRGHYIHHFNGFLLNKVWLINRLKLEETAGGNILIIPNSKFAQAELYVGLERKFRIRMLIRGSKSLKLQNSIAEIIPNYKFSSGIKLSVDVDPINFN